MEVLYTLLA